MLRTGQMNYCAGELRRAACPDRVEKVKPDPLNLSVNTGAGKRLKPGNETCFPLEGTFLFVTITIEYLVRQKAGRTDAGELVNELRRQNLTL